MLDDSHVDHAIIEEPWKFDILRFCYHNALDEAGEAFIDMTLRRGEVVRRLRFLGPRDIAIEKGFPTPTRGMRILDVRGRHLEGLGIQVADFEASFGSVTFWAREVIDLDEISGSEIDGD